MSNLTLAVIALLMIPVMNAENKRAKHEQMNRKKRLRKYTQTEFI